MDNICGHVICGHVLMVSDLYITVCICEGETQFFFDKDLNLT